MRALYRADAAAMRACRLSALQTSGPLLAGAEMSKMVVLRRCAAGGEVDSRRGLFFSPFERLSADGCVLSDAAALYSVSSVRPQQQRKMLSGSTS